MTSSLRHDFPGPRYHVAAREDSRKSIHFDPHGEPAGSKAVLRLIDAVFIKDRVESAMRSVGRELRAAEGTA